MSTWTEVTDYIRTQLRPGVLGNTNVQKILNSVLAVVNQINAGDFTPTPDALWKADVTYAQDVQPVLWQDRWLVSNIDNNTGNVPISTSGVVHPSWRPIGSSSGSGIRIWEAIVYPNTLEIVFFGGNLYYLDRSVVGADPFVSEDFTAELAAEKWKVLTGSGGSSLPQMIIDALLNANNPNEQNPFFTLHDLPEIELQFGVVEKGTVVFASPTELDADGWAWIIAGLEYLGDEQNLQGITGTPVEFDRVDVLVGDDNGDIIYVTGEENQDQLLDPTIPENTILLSRIIRQADGTNIIEPSDPDLSNFVSKSATAEQAIKSDFRIEKQASLEGIFLPASFNQNGRIEVRRIDRINVYNSQGVNNRWNKVCQVTKSVSGQVRFSFLYIATNSDDDLIYLECFCYVNINSSGNLTGYSFNFRGEKYNAEIKAVDGAEDVGIFIRTNRSQNRHWIPIIANVASRITYNQLPPDLENLPGGDQYEFIALVGDGVQSVTAIGAIIDNTDTDNPIIDPLAATASGSTLNWGKDRTYGTYEAPLTGAITDADAGAVTNRQVILRIFHQEASDPFAGLTGWRKVDDGVAYDPAKINLCTVERFSATNKTYQISHYE